MNFESLRDLRDAGFEGFRSVRDLWHSRLVDVPQVTGMYVIARSDLRSPSFLEVSPAGRFKGRDPTIPVAELRDAWVPETCVLYIGKAGELGGDASLRSRLTTYLRHGHGRRSPHWGGRAIWQLSDAGDLLVCWRELSPEETRNMERNSIAAFVAHFGKRPFANRAA